MAKSGAAKTQGRLFKDPKSIPFFQHFNELRRRLTQYFAVLIILSFLFYWEPIHLFLLRDVFFRDVIPQLPTGGFALMGIFDAMTFRFTVGVYGALIITLPLLIYHIFAFFAPAVKQGERKWIFPTIAAAGGLFVAGVLFAYFLILPTAVEWLLAQHTQYTFEVPQAQPWLAGVSLLLLAFGISFELPLVIFALIGLGIISYPAIRESWRVAYVAIFVAAALITPDRGPVTMVALAIAMLFLYEGGLLAARFILASKVDEQYVDAYNEMLLYDNAPTDDSEKLARREKMRKQAEAAQIRIDARNAKNSAGESDQESQSAGDVKGAEGTAGTAGTTTARGDGATADADTNASIHDSLGGVGR